MEPVLNDKEWSEEDWLSLLESLVERRLVTWQEVASLVLGHLNPPQVGTSIASNKTFQKQYPPRKCWAAVREWYYKQKGVCVDCGTRLELQADHKKPKSRYGDDADRLVNMTLRCRRCNVVRRESHKKGGLTFLTTEAALMWLLFVFQPETYQQYERLCRLYGLTMANIRCEEAWAMAKWLERDGEYKVKAGSKY